MPIWSAAVGPLVKAGEALPRWLDKRRKKKQLIGLTVQHEGRPIRLVWDGPLRQLEDWNAVQMSASLQAAIFAAIEGFGEGRLQPLMSGPYERRGNRVYETDKGANWKRPLLSADGRFDLFVVPRAHP